MTSPGVVERQIVRGRTAGFHVSVALPDACQSHAQYKAVLFLASDLGTRCCMCMCWRGTALVRVQVTGRLQLHGLPRQTMYVAVGACCDARCKVHPSAVPTDIQSSFEPAAAIRQCAA